MAQIISIGGHTPQIDPSAYIAESAVITGDVIIEEGASIWPNAVIRGDDDRIIIGKYVNIQDNSTIHTDKGQVLTIGAYSVIGHNAVIHCQSVGEACLIGMGTILLNGAEIGEGSIVGAATLITQNKKIPSRSMVYGTPFRIVRPVTDEELARTREEAMQYYATSRIYKQTQQQ